MRTVILEGVTQRGKQKIQLHGQHWEILKEESGRFLLKSAGLTFHVGGGKMEHDWRWVWIHKDKDFTVNFGLGQTTPPKFAKVVPHLTSRTIIEAMDGLNVGLNLNLQSLKGKR